MQRYKSLKGPFTKMQFVVVPICLNLIKKNAMSLHYSFSIWGTSRESTGKTRNTCSLQPGLCDVNPDLKKEKLQRFKPKKGNWTTSAGLLSPFLSEVAALFTMFTSYLSQSVLVYQKGALHYFKKNPAL